MKTIQDIETLVNQLLKDWLPCKSKPIHIKIVSCKNPQWAAAVSHHTYKQGLKYHKTMTEIDLNVHESFFKYSDKVQERVITHEVYHIIQYSLFLPDELNRLRNTPAPSNKITEYCPNILELEAEVFCINLCGQSTSSYPNAKQDPIYREILDKILCRQEIFEEIPD